MRFHFKTSFSLFHLNFNDMKARIEIERDKTNEKKTEFKKWMKLKHIKMPNAFAWIGGSVEDIDVCCMIHV